MSKKQRNRPRSRAEPVTQKRSDTSWLCSVDAYNILTAGPYTRLSDCPEVKMCAHRYADLVSNMTIHLMQNTEQGDVRVRNALASKLDISPNRLMKTRKAFIYNIVWTLLLSGDGNQVTYPRFNTDGLLENLEPLKPSRVIFDDIPNGYVIRYGEKTFSPDEVLHFIINPDPEKPWIGTGYKAVLKDVIKGIRQAGKTKQALLESPAPSIIVKVDALTEEFSSLEGRKKLSAQYLDSSENGRPWFIPAEAFEVKEVKPLTLNDLALAKNLEIDKRTVAGIFSMPPFLVGVGDFNKDEYNKFIGTEIMSMAQTLQQEFSRGLLYSPDMYWRFNPRSLYSYSLTEIKEIGSEMVDRMAMRRNEWRDWIGMGPDPEMEELLALENYIPASMLGQQKKLNSDNRGNNKRHSRQENDDLQKVKTIIKSLPKEEKQELGPRFFYDDAQHRYIEETDDELIGFIENRITGTKGHINIAVHPDHRGKGIADKLVTIALKAAPDFDLEKIYWITTPENEASRKLAEKHGFKLKSEKDEEVRYVLEL